MASGPLDGLRVLDLTAVVAGPFCTMLLGDLGADVIKIEPPEGDSTRRFGRPQKNGVTASFLAFNRNKRSIVVDLKKPDGPTLVLTLAAKADALVENNRPGVTDRLGIGYADIRRVNPKIVYCSICGFGPKGWRADHPAYDPVIQAFSGMAAIQGGSQRPTAIKMALADKLSGMTAALSVVSALLMARNRGVGQFIRVPMLEATMAFVCNDTMAGYTFVPEDEFKGQAPRTQSLDPFKTSDGWISLAPFTDAQYERLCAAAGHPEWWNCALGRAERLRSIIKGLAEVLRQETSARWLARLEEADIPCGPVHDYETLFSDDEIVANESFSLYEYPGVGTVRTVNPGARLNETPMRLRRLPPKLGEHTDEVLLEAGFERSRIEELRRDRVIN